MKKIYDTVKKNNQSRLVVKYRPPSIDEEFDDYCLYDDDDYSEDEGTSAPLKNKGMSAPQTSAFECFSNTQCEDHHTKLLSGYTEGNLEIKVNKPPRTQNLQY